MTIGRLVYGHRDQRRHCRQGSRAPVDSPVQIPTLVVICDLAANLREVRSQRLCEALACFCSRTTNATRGKNTSVDASELGWRPARAQLSYFQVQLSRAKLGFKVPSCRLSTRQRDYGGEMELEPGDTTKRIYSNKIFAIIPLSS
jgi:hypothetical protein